MSEKCTAQRTALTVALFPTSHSQRQTCRFSARTAELFVLLLSRPEDRFARKTVIDRLWGDVCWDVGRRRLNSTVHRLRTEILAGVAQDRLHTSPDSVWLSLADRDWVDLAEFEAAFNRSIDSRPLTTTEFAELEAAIVLYAPQLLPSANGDWILALRARLENQAIAIRSRLAHEALANGDPQRAMYHSTAALEIDDLREDLHRVVIKAHLTVGDRAAATCHFERVKTLLGEQLDASPMPETTQLIFGTTQATPVDPGVEDLRRSLGEVRSQLKTLLTNVDSVLDQLA